MAQVRKMQKGGKTFKLAGYTFDTSNKEDMKLLQELSTDPRFGGIAQGVLDNVNDAAYTNTLNAYRTADGRVVMEGELQHVKDKHMSAGTQKATSRKDTAFWNAVKRRSGKEWANDMDAFLSEITKRKGSTSTDSSTADDKIKITGVGTLGGKWGYNDEGWDEANTNNAAMLNQWNLLEKYAQADEEGRKGYDVSGLDETQLNAFLEMYKSDPELFNKYRNSFAANQARLADSSDFYSTYGWFGFTPGTAEEVAAEQQARDLKANKDKLAKLGYTSEGIENILGFDKDGNLIVTDAFREASGLSSDTNYWLNDAWADLLKTEEQKKYYSPLRGHVIWGNRVYKENDPALHALLQSSGYTAANKAYDATKADEIMQTRWGSGNDFATAYDRESYYSPWAHGLEGLRYRTLGGYKLNDNERLVEYTLDSDQTDAYGYRAPKYAILDSQGNLVRDNVDINTLTTDGERGVIDSDWMVQRLGADAGNLAGTIVSGTKNPDGTASRRFYYQDPDSGNFWIQDPELRGSAQGKALRVPQQVAVQIPEETWEYFRTNPDAKRRLFRILRQYTDNNFVRGVNRVFDNNATFIALSRDLKKSGLDETQAKSIIQALKDTISNEGFRDMAGDSSVSKRRETMLSEPDESTQLSSFKEGGKIEKDQKGTTLGKNAETKARAMNVSQGTKKDANLSQSVGLGSKDSKEWTSLDSAELTALVADLGSLGLSFIPGVGGGAAAATGFMGSTANLTADIKRDGLDWGDVGSYALNLALDAATLIPGAGGAAKLAKSSKNIKRLASLLQKGIKLGAIAGVGDAVVNTVNKIANGESFTMSDVRRLVNGVSGIATIGKTGLGLRGKVDGTPELKIKNTNGNPELEFSADEIKNLRDKSPEEIKAAIVKKWKAKNPGSGKKDNEILEGLDLSEIISSGKRPQLKFWKGLKETEKVNIPKNGKRARTDEELGELAKKQSDFKNWVMGIQKPQQKSHTLIVKEHASPDSPQFFNFKRKTISHNLPGSMYRPGFTPHPVSSVLPSIQFSKTQIPEPVYFPEDVETTDNRKPMVFKKGGILKANKGIYDIAAGILKENPLNLAGTITNQDGLLTPNLDIVGKARRSTMETTPVTTPIKPLSMSTDYAKDHAIGTGNETSAVRSMDVAGSSSGRPTSKGTFNTALFMRDMSGIGNHLRALKESKQIYDIDRKMARLSGMATQTAPNIITNNRLISPRTSQYDELGSQMLTNIDQINGFDASLNVAAKLAGYKQWGDLMKEKIDKTSEDFYNQQLRNTETWKQQQLYNTEVANKNRQTALPAAIAGEEAKAGHLTRRSGIFNKSANAIQDKLHKLGTIDAQTNLQAMQYRDAAARSTDPAQRAAFNSLATDVVGSEYRNALKQQAGLAFVKKGGTLRPISEQLLLDNEKAVQKALEKLNDSAMKLILKALS